MQTRERVYWVGLCWLAAAILNVAAHFPRLHQSFSSRTAFDLILLVFWGGLGALWLPILAFNSWQVGPESINHRILWKSRKIRMDRIVAIRPRQASRLVVGEPLEIEVHRFGSTVYPHDYIVANPVDREGFLQAIRAYAPQISIEA
jgi:hypothetical protein